MESPFPERLPSYRGSHREMRCAGLARLSFEKRSIPTPYPFALSSSSPASTREDHLRDPDDDCFQARPRHLTMTWPKIRSTDFCLPTNLLYLHPCSRFSISLRRNVSLEKSPEFGFDAIEGRGFSRDPFPPGGPCSDEDGYWPSLFVRSRLHRGRFVTPVLALESTRIEIVSSMPS